LSWADGAGLARLPPQLLHDLDHTAASIPEPEFPAGGIDTVLQDQPPVDLAAMADSGDGDDTCLVINGIDDPVVP